MSRGKSRMDRSFGAVIDAFLDSKGFEKLAPATQRNYRRALDLALKPGGLGDCAVDFVKTSIIQAYLDALADKPGIQSIAKTALGAVQKFALARALVPQPFMIGTEIHRSETGHEPWEMEHVELAMRAARSDLGRAVALAFHTGQRGSDTVRMCPTDVEEKPDPYTGGTIRGVNVRQQKTDVRLWVPLLPEFEAILATWERRPGPFLRKPDGAPYTRQELSCAWNYELKTNKRLRPIAEAGLVLHGLRATAVVWRRKRGLNALQISSMIGMSLPMVERYCRLADKSELALAAVHFLRGTAGEHAVSTFKGLEEISQ